MELEGRTALVTGAAHRLGRAIACRLARGGARLAIHYGGSAEQAARTVADIEDDGGEAWAVQADLARSEAIEGLFGAVEQRFGGLDVLVNSAASFRSQPFDDISAADWDAVLSVNLRAPFLCTQAAARLMGTTARPDDAPGVVINVCDLSALGVWRGYAHHSVSKAGLLHLTRVAAWELAPRVRVNAIAPGAILPPPGEDPDGEAWRRRGEDVPLGRTGSPEDVAAAVAFVVENEFVNGALVPVDGGERLIQGGRR